MNLIALRKLQYVETEFVRPEYIRWQLNENPAGRAISWIAIDQNDKVLGEYWMIPINFKINKDLHRGAYGANALIHSKYRRMGIFTMLGQKCLDNCVEGNIKFTFYVPNQSSMKGLLHRLNCRDLGEMPVLIHPLNINKLAAFKFKNRITQELASGIMRNIYQVVISFKKHKTYNREIELVKVSKFEKDFDSFWYRVRDKYRCIAIRDSIFMNWRYNHIPVRKYNILLAKKGNRILGYVVSRSATILGLKSGFIIDFMFESSTLGWIAAYALVDAAIKRFNAERADLICCLFLSHTEEYCLLRNRNFFVCPRIFKPHPFHLVTQIHDSNMIEKDLNNARYWFFSLGDYDVL